MFYWFTMILYTLFVFGCNQADPYYIAEDPSTEADQQIQSDMQIPSDMLGTQNVDQSTINEEELVLAQQVAFIDAKLTPRKPLYTVNETATVDVTCYDRYGNEVEQPTLLWTARPDMTASITNQTITFLQEGQGAIRICVDLNRSVCGRVSFYVDNAPPQIILTTPQPFALVTGEDQSITVQGNVQGQEKLYINEVEVLPDSQGNFSYILDLRFGYNTIEVTAFDGVRTPAVNLLRSVLYAPQTKSMDEEEISWDKAIVANITTDALYQMQNIEADPTEPLTIFDDISNSLSYILSYVDPLTLFDPSLSNDEQFQLLVNDVDMGMPQVQIIPQDQRLEVFIRFANFRVTLSGFLNFEGIDIRLDGIVSIDMSAFTALSISINEGGIDFDIEDVGIALESLSATMNDPTAQALIDTVTSTLSLAVSSWSEDFIQNLANHEIPNLIEQQSIEALRIFDSFSFDFTQEDLQVSARAEFEPQLTQISISEDQGILAQFSLDIQRQNTADSPLPAYQQNIIPIHIPQEIPWQYNRHASVAISLSVINTMLYDLWQQEFLQLDLSDKLPDFLSLLIGKAEVKSVLPPLFVETVTGSQAALALTIEGLYLDLWSPDLSRKDRYRVSLYAGLGLQSEAPDLSLLNPDESISDGRLQFILPQATLRVSLEEQGGDLPVVDPSLIENSVSLFLLPEISKLVEEGLQIDYPVTHIDLSEQTGQNLFLVPNFEQGLQVEAGWLIFNSRLRSIFIPN